ncbi:FmdE family protein [Halomonas cibimaris]|uniref:FmdE family protein n=1 Tax=Halomonas cibimaris TaxID=657012 RepID=A0ABP7LC13_9GAMM
MAFPDFFDQAPTVRLRDPLAALLGSADDGIMDYRYADAVRLTGHSCPTVAGAFLTARAALKALYPASLPERGNIAVHMPHPEHEGTVGVTAQVLTLMTGAAGDGGFKGIGERFARHGRLHFADTPDRHGAIRFTRLDTGQSVRVTFNHRYIPADPTQRERLQAIVQGSETPAQQSEFARLWQARVRRMLIDHADDPALIQVETSENA